MECTAPKPGNVSPGHAFEDLCYEDFQKSAPITAKWCSAARTMGVGAVVEEAASEIWAAVQQNTHLGILLLLAPLAAATDRDELPAILNQLTVTDAEHVYRAIRSLEPGGLGEVDNQDVHSVPTSSLLECMQLAADRDTIANQYVNAFADVFRFADGLNFQAFEACWRTAVVRLHIDIMADIPDTLIARKCGTAVAIESQTRAAAVVAAEYTEDVLIAFDQWLRADGHRRNPGTTADMVAAVLFVGIREGTISVPPRDSGVAHG